MENGKAKPFDQVVMDIPIGSGPYKIGPVQNFGKDITYVRDPNYWAADLNVRRGTANFDRITVKIYKDNTARLEALKAGEFDLMRFFSAGDWARRTEWQAVQHRRAGQGGVQAPLPTGFQSYVLNTRKDKLRDVRVRQGAGPGRGLRVDEPADVLQRLPAGGKGLFGNTDCQATGLPGPQELALLEPWRGKVPDAVFGPMYVPPRTDGDSSLRANLRKARACSGRPAGKSGMAPCAMPGARRSRWSTWTATRPAPAWCRPGCATSRSWASAALPAGGLRAVPAAPAEV
jgi:microcin C transport system substrate-binding protein